jgi:hypothetical protein
MMIPTRSMWRLQLYSALLALLVCPALSVPAFAAAAGLQPAPETVDGSNLTRADFAEGGFEQRGERWVEYGPEGRTRFYFEETGRDEWSVYLIDRSRNVAIQLDVHRRMVTLSERGRRQRDLHRITDVMASARSGLPLGRHSLQSVSDPGRYARHANALGELSQIRTRLDRADSTFEVVHGLNGRVDSISFESTNYPGHFLRHQNSRMRLARNDGSALFRDDATFFPRQGVTDAGTVSLESSNYPGRFITHRDNHLWLSTSNGSDSSQVATFRFGPPND